jgi:hypothetical protein
MRADRGGQVPVTARGVPFLFGGPWLRPDVRYGPGLDSVRAAPVQAAAFGALLRLAENDAADEDRVSVYCAGVLANYLITPVSATILATIQSQDRRFVSAERCRFHLESQEIDRPGMWPRRAWLLWATTPEEPDTARAVLDIGYHAGLTRGAGWRCFLTKRDGNWLVDSTVVRWQS